MKFVRFSRDLKSNSPVLAEFTMFFRESFLKKELEKAIVNYNGCYITMRSAENDRINVGTIFDEPDNPLIIMNREILVKLLDQVEYYLEHKMGVMYLIQNQNDFQITVNFPTKNAQFIKVNDEYVLNFCDDSDLQLLAEFLVHFKKLHDMESFVQDNDFDIDDITWELGEITLKGFSNEVRLVNREGQEIKIVIKDLIRLMKEWQALLYQEPQEIYLVLENAEYRLTTEYTPE